jgi:hypothetical protein
MDPFLFSQTKNAFESFALSGVSFLQALSQITIRRAEVGRYPELGFKARQDVFMSLYFEVEFHPGLPELFDRLSGFFNGA